MNFLGHDIAFWFASLGAAFLKMVLSPWGGAIKGAISFVSAVFLAMIFTDPVLTYLNLNPETYKSAIAALVTLTGEGVVRWLLQVVDKPTRIWELIKLWRGGGRE